MKNWLFIVCCFTFSSTCYSATLDKSTPSNQSDLKNKTLTFNTFNAYTLSQTVHAILERAYSKLGIDIKIRYLPGKRALIASNSGIVDGELFRIIGMSKHYPNLLAVPVPVIKLNTTVYTRDTHFTVKDWNSLKPYKIGFLRGFKKAELNTLGMQVYQDDSLDVLFKLLDKGRIDLVVESSLGASVILNKGLLPNIKALSPAVDSFNIYHYLHRKNALLLEPLANALKVMHQSGEVEAIVQQSISQLLAKNRIK